MCLVQNYLLPHFISFIVPNKKNDDEKKITWPPQLFKKKN